jgi:non-ribosomal peptide synthetase component F
MAIAFLGIHKAGLAYFPLDSDYPVERLDFMLEDLKCPLLFSLTLLSNQLSVDDIKNSPNFQPLAHPCFWAAWVCQGNTNPFPPGIL